MHKVKNTVSVGRSLLSARFLLSALILVLTAIGLRPAVQALSRYYTKKPIDIRHPLKEFDVSRLPSFRNGWELSWRTALVEDLATDEYTHIILDKKFGKGPKRAELFVTYYNNPQDKIPHIPDVCGRQEGGIVRKIKTIMLDTPQLGPDYPKIQANLLLFQFGRKIDLVLIYCLCVEGEFPHTRNQARWVLAKPGNRHTYFSKIEARTWIGDDPAEAIEMCKTLLCEALPILTAEYFPDKEQLKRR